MSTSALQTNWLYSALAHDADLQDLVAVFAAEMPERADNLLARLRTRDWVELKRAAHQLKGVAGSYGFAPITLAAARVEEAIVKEEPEEEIYRATEDLADLCRRVRVGTP
jgi:HPt (histidine-containing phosphotransfer) domain-containing protein